MLQPQLSTILGLLFVLTGGLTVWLIVHASRNAKNSRTNARLISAHRIGGYLFITLFCVMTFLMVVRVKDAPDSWPARTTIHATLAMLLIPLLFTKVAIARYYRHYHGMLMPVGLVIVTLSFALVSMSAGPYLLRRASIREISLEAGAPGSQKVDLDASLTLMRSRCSSCHTLDRIAGARKDARGWQATVNRMRALPGSGISGQDAKVILAYLVSRNSLDASTSEGAERVGRALVDTHCNRCHNLDRVFKSARSPEAWRKIVTRMVHYARGVDGFFKPGEDEQIIRFLSATQTPEAMRQEAKTITAATAPASLKADLPAATHSGRYSIALIVLLGAIFGVLIVRRPKPVLPPSPAIPRQRRSSILQLARVEQQTPLAKTLRFLLPDEERLQARPGQFLTFRFLINGKRVTRSYSICSSPCQSGYVEITVKRVENGCVSVFLNERAAPGLTVEATGPWGAFCFDETAHTKVVFIAAGSGITPFMSMLRYMDDRCTATDATLIYSARTGQEILFENELLDLGTRLPNFRYVATLTKPGPGWTGPRGRLSRELVTAHVPDVASAMFFLCGPQPFMDGVQEILVSLGVQAARIKRESFGTQNAPSDRTGAGRVEFVRSRRSCDMAPGTTLLEAAEQCGVVIPYGCRQGQCGTCTARLLDGEVQMDAEGGLDAGLKAQGYVLTCVGRPLGQVKLDA